MKLGDYLPEVPQFAQSLVDLNQQVSMLSLMKSAGDTGEAPTIGLDHVVNTWVRPVSYTHLTLPTILLV